MVPATSQRKLCQLQAVGLLCEPQAGLRFSDAPPSWTSPLAPGSLATTAHIRDGRRVLVVVDIGNDVSDDAVDRRADRFPPGWVHPRCCWPVRVRGCWPVRRCGRWSAALSPMPVTSCRPHWRSCTLSWSPPLVRAVAGRNSPRRLATPGRRLIGNTMRVSKRVHGHSLLSVVYIAWDGDPVAERQQDDDPTS
jgi:hypothetical protein